MTSVYVFSDEWFPALHTHTVFTFGFLYLLKQSNPWTPPAKRSSNINLKLFSHDLISQLLMIQLRMSQMNFPYLVEADSADRWK